MVSTIFHKVSQIPSETIQKLTINHQNLENKNYKAQTQPFTCTKISENTNTSMEASPIENMDAIIHSQPDTRLKATTETHSNSALLDGGTLLSLHWV